MESRCVITAMIEATENNEIFWEQPEGHTLYQTTFKDHVYLLTKYPLPNKDIEISFNKLDEYGHIVKPFKEYPHTHEYFPDLIKLHILVEEKLEK